MNEDRSTHAISGKNVAVIITLASGNIRAYADTGYSLGFLWAGVSNDSGVAESTTAIFGDLDGYTSSETL